MEDNYTYIYSEFIRPKQVKKKEKKERSCCKFMDFSYNFKRYYYNDGQLSENKKRSEERR